MATPRNSQAHQKRVQKIAEDAANKIAADAPLEEDIVVVVEELPPGETRQVQRGRSSQAPRDTADAMLGAVAQSQKFVADGITRWIAMTTAPFGARAFSVEGFEAPFDARHLMQEGFRLAEEVLASQKEFALKIVEAMTPAKAA